VVRQVYPDGEVVTTTYNLRGLPAAVTGQSAYLTNATYNALGQPLQQTWGNTRVTTYAYHPQNFRLTQLQVSGGLLDLRYGYDRVGNVTAITDTVNSNQVQTFGYDARDRLTWARTNGVGNGQYSEAYGYDRMGNIITRTIGGAPQAYTYACPPPSVAPGLPPTLPHRVYFPLVMKGYGPESPPMAACVAPFAVVSTTAGFRAAYDANGNMVLRVEVSGTQRITYTQEYNAENRLTVVTNTVTGQVTRFVYDGDGNRVLRMDGSGTTVTIGDYYEQQGSTVRKYYYAGGQRIAVRVNGTLYFLHGDHLGSATLTTGAGGNWVGEARYTPYGEMRRDYPRGVIPTDLLYTGQRQEGFRLYDYRARFYSPGLGRFVSADTIVPGAGNPQNLNRYAYVRNNPLRYTDPTGRWTFEESPDDPYFIGPWLYEAQRRQDFITPSSPPLPIEAQWAKDLSEREPDYRGVSVEVGVPTLVMLAGTGLSEMGVPELGLPIALVGAVLDLNPVTGPVAVGGALEWDNYGHHYGSLQLSWGHAWPTVPVAVNAYGVRIFTEGNRPATEQEVTEFIPGVSANLEGLAIFGGSLVWNPTFSEEFPGTFGVQTGSGFPPLQVGGSASFAFRID
jgi:RHS repeat-associated protein